MWRRVTPVAHGAHVHEFGELPIRERIAAGLASGRVRRRLCRGWTSANGSPIYGPVTVSVWATSNPSVATVSSAGRVTAIASGTANITANALGASAAGVVNVFSESDVAALEVTCTATVSLRRPLVAQGRSR